jgi:hypothetical protein
VISQYDCQFSLVTGRGFLWPSLSFTSDGLDHLPVLVGWFRLHSRNDVFLGWAQFF